MRECREAAAEGHEGAIEALEVLCHRPIQLLGSMAGTRRGVNVLSLTGGIGEHYKAKRSELQDAPAWWGAEVETLIVPASAPIG